MTVKRAGALTRRSLYLGSVVLLLVALVFYCGWPLFEFLKDPQRVRSLIESAGPWGPLVFMGLELLQVFFAPVPGQITGLAGGYLFGALWGTVYTVIGSAIGVTIVIVLSRKLGRPFVERFVDAKTYAKFNYIIDSKAAKTILFLVFLVPIFPDDLICYIAGLTKLKIRELLVISTVGRIPGQVALAIAGSGMAESDRLPAIIVSTTLVILVLIAYWQRKQLETFVKRLS